MVLAPAERNPVTGVGTAALLEGDQVVNLAIADGNVAITSDAGPEPRPQLLALPFAVATAGTAEVERDPGGIHRG